ncbi:hypothetical protein [Paenibacillus lautus]|uniref:hypothetical protein n=1 Tax=Paenibacillus lautus TaxID=1401 RepID=UPI001C1180E9|nr:hypothetical protein [Paenibacillus lautus]MBU5345187.1 hypothetical protein [Paenibacillus lautus]
MTNPVTPNIGLNKIDRTSPSTTYFDLEKYIDQNADAVDRFAGETSESIHALEKRLDTEERREVVLQPGLQIVNAERSAPFKLSGIKGRTLVNLLGRDGDFEKIIPTVLNASTISALDNTSMYSGSNSIKVIATGSETVEHYADMTAGYKAKQGSYYVLIGMLKVNKGAGQIKIYNNKSQLSPEFFISESNIVSQTGDFSLVRTAFNPIVDCDVIPRLYLLKDPSTSLYVQNGESANFDCIRIFEVSKQEYDSFGSLTYEQIAAMYPYVDSIQPVRNPYAIRQGENLLPPFYEWTLDSEKTQIVDPYTLRYANGDVGARNYAIIDIIPNTDYILSGETMGGTSMSGGYFTVGWLDANGRFISWGAEIFAGTAPIKVTSPPHAVKIQVVCAVSNSGKTSYTFKNPMLSLGPVFKSFRPREDSMLALKTDLYADPVTETNADEVFEKDGQYFKLVKWKKIIIDNNQSYIFHGSKTGFKWINFAIANGPNQNSVNLFLTSKFDGKYINHIPGSLAAGTLPDQSDYDSTNKRIYISISNTDSGWSDNYTPTADEIKAYFMGWRMFDGTVGASSLYNRTDGSHKSWVRIIDWLGRVDNEVPTTQAPNWMPYQLVYQLATPTVEPIVSEGMFTFNEGDNLIEVGTGFVIRERANPSVYMDGYVRINDSSGTGQTLSFLSYKVARIAAIFMNGKRDDRWILRTSPNSSLVNGMGYAYTTVSNYDPSAAYSVNYLMLDKSSIVPFTGTYAANEKAMLQELTDAVQQNATAISVSLEAANKAFQSGVNAKNVMVEAINASLGGASINDSWATLAEKVRSNKGMEVEGFTTTFEYPYSYVPAGSTKVENIYTFDAGLSNIFFIPKKTQKDQAGASYITIVTGGTLMLGCKWHLRDKNSLLHRIASSGPGYWSRGPTLYLLSLQFDLEYKRCYFSYASTETSGGVITTTIPDNFDTSGPVSLVIELEPGTTPPTDSKWKIFMDGKFILG